MKNRFMFITFSPSHGSPILIEKLGKKSVFVCSGISGDGERVVSRLRGPESYTLSALTALASVERVLAGRAPPGFQTPGKAFGPDFILEIPGVERFDD